MNFIETMALYRAISAFSLDCSNESPKICIVDNQKEGYVLKIRMESAPEYCHWSCIKNFSKNHNFQVTEDGKYLSIQLP
jgi:hypothetical protein